ncbi:fluoride efflux transporter CrcB [soil metagenome]
MQAYLIVFLGAGVGGAFRHGVNVAAARILGGVSFPYGTLTVNIVGSFVMGLLASYFALRGDVSQHWRLFLTTGILGGFTTFSAFSLDVAVLYERGQAGWAAFYILASVLVSVTALFAGLYLIRTVAPA